MANFMYVLKQDEKEVIKLICPKCAKRGIVVNTCSTCYGKGVVNKKLLKYKVSATPIEIIKIDRDPKTGTLRYWEDNSNFFYESITPELNQYVPEIPYGLHLCHFDKKSAELECDRVNTFLKKELVKAIPSHVPPANISALWECAKASKKLTDEFQSFLDDFSW